jgi:outer membrane immunogenic protein
MKTLLSAALLVAATSVSANAADMSMPYKAAPVAQSVYNWTGFYLGGTAGGGLANSDHTSPDFSLPDAKFNEAFGTVGLTAGYNWQFGHTVLGIEGDYNWASVDKTKNLVLGDAFDGEFASTRFRMSEFATVRARAGLAFDRTLIYATAGAAFAHIRNTTTAIDEEAGTSTASEDKWKAGLAVGAGVEFALSQNWTLKGEYMLMQFQNSDAEFLNATTGPTCGIANCRMNYSESVQVARIGVNYKFGN